MANGVDGRDTAACSESGLKSAGVGAEKGMKGARRLFEGCDIAICSQLIW